MVRRAQCTGSERVLGISSQAASQLRPRFNVLYRATAAEKGKGPAILLMTFDLDYNQLRIHQSRHRAHLKLRNTPHSHVRFPRMCCEIQQPKFHIYHNSSPLTTDF